MRHTSPLALLAGAIALAACGTPAPKTEPTMTTAVETTNPLLAPWTGPYGGVPPFDRASVDLLGPAMESAMAAELAEIEAIAGNPAPPTFENTIAALERAGRVKDRVDTIYGIYSSSLATPAFQALEREMAPRLAAHRDRITQNEAVFRRIEAVYNSPDKASLTPEQQRLVWLRYTNLVLAGAKLAPDDKKRVSEINQRLASLYTTFSQNVLADEEHQFVVLGDEADLAGLPAGFVTNAAAAAKDHGLDGKWLVLNTRSSVEPFLTYSDRRDLRKDVFDRFVQRGDEGDEHDNNAIIPEILALRAERARLLGFETHAHWRLQNTMAKTPERTLELMEAVWAPAVARAHEEVADMQARSRTPRAPASPSSPGTTAITPRRSARRSTTWTRTRSSPTCSSTRCGRRPSGRPDSSTACSSSRFLRAACRSTTRTSRSGRSGIATAGTSACSISTPTPARASAPAPG